MNTEKQRIAIAEACGWKPYESLKLVPHPRGRGHMRCDADHPNGYPSNMPDFINDLNAMHEAERTLTSATDQFTYAAFLLERFEWVDVNSNDLSCDEVYHAALSTAERRAEAFLKTLGLWEEE